jgi:hypothetical protein
MELSATMEGAGAALAVEVVALAEVANSYLDQPARAELAALAASLAG